jgi:hypothetical protein
VLVRALEATSGPCARGRWSNWCGACTQRQPARFTTRPSGVAARACALRQAGGRGEPDKFRGLKETFWGTAASFTANPTAAYGDSTTMRTSHERRRGARRGTGATPSMTVIDECGAMGRVLAIVGLAGVILALACAVVVGLTSRPSPALTMGCSSLRSDRRGRPRAGGRPDGQGGDERPASLRSHDRSGPAGRVPRARLTQGIALPARGWAERRRASRRGCGDHRHRRPTPASLNGSRLRVDSCLDGLFAAHKRPVLALFALRQARRLL